MRLQQTLRKHVQESKNLPLCVLFNHLNISVLSPQLHVLSFTVHYLLKSLAEVIQPGDLDPALSSIQDVFYPELFGHVAEEKEVAAIKAKYFEAKFVKGYDAYGILARRISADQLDRLILPVRNVS